MSYENDYYADLESKMLEEARAKEEGQAKNTAFTTAKFGRPLSSEDFAVRPEKVARLTERRETQQAENAADDATIAFEYDEFQAIEDAHATVLEAEYVQKYAEEIERGSVR
ncbi:MAG: hypothetical protein FWE45_02545 [Firmicutes bacterium]|nr:hypothetical protein [Bacillota bacterium]